MSPTSTVPFTPFTSTASASKTASGTAGTGMGSMGMDEALSPVAQHMQSARKSSHAGPSTTGTELLPLDTPRDRTRAVEVTEAVTEAATEAATEAGAEDAEVGGDRTFSEDFADARSSIYSASPYQLKPIEVDVGGVTSPPASQEQEQEQQEPSIREQGRSGDGDDDSFVSVTSLEDFEDMGREGAQEREQEQEQEQEVSPSVSQAGDPTQTPPSDRVDSPADSKTVQVSEGVAGEVAAAPESMPRSVRIESRENAKQPTHPYLAYQRLMGGRRRATRAGVGGLPKGPKSATKRRSFLYGDAETPDEVESRELYHNEMAWLLGGSGRWSIDQESRDRAAREAKSRSKPGDWGATNPAAQMSMTAPRMITDMTDAGSIFALNMQCNSQWKLEEGPGMIRCMVVNPVESILLTCSRTGVRLWSLTSHPLLHVSSYAHHHAPPFAAGFLRGGLTAATCDGNVHIWDIETRSTVAFLAASAACNFAQQDKGAGFSSMSIVTPREGSAPSLGASGDDQLLTTLGATLSFHDLRLNCNRSITPVAE
ncbi:hypothetical protein B484DRAFT_409146, partial [Ochromonadaceae sp. CCMP2298]